MSHTWVLYEAETLDSSHGTDHYAIGEFDSAETARAHVPVYARERGQAVESLHLVLEERDGDTVLATVPL